MIRHVLKIANLRAFRINIYIPYFIYVKFAKMKHREKTAEFHEMGAAVPRNFTKNTAEELGEKIVTI